MIYIDNSSDYSQRVFIPRDESVDGADITGSTFSLQDKYYVITKNGATVPIHPDQGYQGISGGSITVRVQSTGGTNYFPGEYIDIDENNVISVTGLTETIQETVTAMTLDYATTAQVQTMITAATDGLATTQYVDNAVSGKADTTAVTQSISNALTAYTPTTGFTTINGSAITESGNIEIESGGVTTGEVQTMITAATSGLASTQYVDNAVTAATDDMATRTWVNEQGFLTEHQSLSGYSTTQETEAMITAATSGLPTTQYVDNAVSGKADTTAVTQSISNALTAYTPTTGFTTINGSAITEGGNIVIEGGGDASSIEMITELPSDPVDGAVYNYNGKLIKYVNGPGNWGEWAGFAQTGSSSWDGDSSSVPIRNQFALNYISIPASLDGSLLISFQYFTQKYLYIYLDLTNDCVIVKRDSASTSADYTIQHNSGETDCLYDANNVSRYLGVSWFDNIINFNYSRDVHMANILQPTASTGHYELMEEPVVSDTSLVFGSQQYGSATNNYYGSSTWGNLYMIPKLVSNNGRILQMGLPVNYHSQMFNGRYYKGWTEVAYDSSKTSIPSFWAPTASGNQGELLVSDGQNGYNATPPVWKTIAQALGIDFWTGTQAEYNALSAHSSTTLYIIIPQ